MFHSKAFFFLSLMELRIFDTNEKSKSHYQVAFIFTRKKVLYSILIYFNIVIFLNTIIFFFELIKKNDKKSI